MVRLYRHCSLPEDRRDDQNRDNRTVLIPPLARRAALLTKRDANREPTCRGEVVRNLSWKRCLTLLLFPYRC